MQGLGASGFAVKVGDKLPVCHRGHAPPMASALGGVRVCCTVSLLASCVGMASQEDAAPSAVSPLPQGTHFAGGAALQPLSQAAAHQDIVL